MSKISLKNILKKTFNKKKKVKKNKATSKKVAKSKKSSNKKIKKVIKSKKKYAAHDESDSLAVGDKVRIRECRPVSRNKRFEVIEKVSA